MNQSFKRMLIRATYDKRKLHLEILKLHKCAKEMECALDKLIPSKNKQKNYSCKRRKNNG